MKAPGLPVPSGPAGLCGRKAAVNLKTPPFRAQELCESRGREAKVEEVSVSALAIERYGLDLGARVDCLC